VGSNIKGSRPVKYLVSVPYTSEEYKNDFLKTCKLDNVYLIDNTSMNMGFPASTNTNMKKFIELGYDWFIVCGTSIRFGESGGLDFIEALEKSNNLVVEAQVVYGWHLIAFHRTIIENVGLWDENFVPYGYDDLDYSLRIHKTFSLPGANRVPLDDGIDLWTKASIDVDDIGMGHSVKTGKVDFRPELNEETREYYKSKWGMYPGSGETTTNTYEFPFNNKDYDLKYFPPRDRYEYHVV